MEARRAPLLIGAGAAIVAIAAAVVLVRRSPSAIVGESSNGAPALGSAVGGATTAPSAIVPASTGPAGSSSAASSPSPAPSEEPHAVASAAAASSAPHGPTMGSSPDSFVAGPGGDSGAASAEAGASRPLILRIDETSDGKSLELTPGQQLVATLDANPTTGFDWAVIKAPPALGTPDMGYVAGGSAPGSPGKRLLTWTLKSALPAGAHVVELGYARSFEKGVPPFKTFRFKVRGPSPSPAR